MLGSNGRLTAAEKADLRARSRRESDEFGIPDVVADQKATVDAAKPVDRQVLRRLAPLLPCEVNLPVSSRYSSVSIDDQQAVEPGSILLVH